MPNHIVLFEPQIPANTGNIARTCAGTNTHLHLIEPLGFLTDDKHLKRAGLDYWNDVNITYHANLPAFMETIGNDPLYLITKFGHRTYSEPDYSMRSSLNNENALKIIILFLEKKQLDCQKIL